MAEHTEKQKEKQMDQFRTQLDEMQARMEQMGRSMDQYRAMGGEMVAGARGKAMEMGRKVSEQKGVALPFGLLLTVGLTAMAVWIFFPDLGERLKSMMQMRSTETHKR